MTVPIYLDYNATTPVDPEVLDAMLPYFTEAFGNPASGHSVGRAARGAVERARAEIADAVGAGPSEVILLSGATESVNLALKGIAHGSTDGRRHIITFASEHKGVIDACKALERSGFELSVLPVTADGLPDRAALAGTLRFDTLIVSVMAANNETGVIGPVREIADAAHAVRALVHCDATQALGKIDFDFHGSGADLVSFSSHKAYGPKGVGALVLTSEAARHLRPLIDGGGHERGLRSGTLNVPGAVGFGTAARIARDRLHSDATRLSTLRDRLETAILSSVPDTSVNGGAVTRLPGTTNIRFPGQPADAIMLAMPEIAVSTGSACTSESVAPSHVLRAMGLGYEEADQCIRFSLGRFTTVDDVNAVVDATVRAVALVAER